MNCTRRCQHPTWCAACAQQSRLPRNSSVSACCTVMASGWYHTLQAVQGVVGTREGKQQVAAITCHLHMPGQLQGMAAAAPWGELTGDRAAVGASTRGPWDDRGTARCGFMPRTMRAATARGWLRGCCSSWPRGTPGAGDWVEPSDPEFDQSTGPAQDASVCTSSPARRTRDSSVAVCSRVSGNGSPL
jgi:hypothetical protein